MIACRCLVASVVLDVLKERQNGLANEVREVQLGDRAAMGVCGEEEQELQGIAIRPHSAGADVALTHQVLSQESPKIAPKTCLCFHDIHLLVTFSMAAKRTKRSLAS